MKRKKRKLNHESLLRKIAQGVILTAFLLIFIFCFGSETLFGEFLFYETMPFYRITGAGPVFFKLNEETGTVNHFDDGDAADKETFLSGEYDVYNALTLDQDETYIETFNPDRIEDEAFNLSGDAIVGINDVIYQDEAEFGTYPDSKYKENFTSADMEKLRDVDYLLSSFYNKDANAGIIKSNFDADRFFNADLTLERNSAEPQVLIFHTHASTEFFIDSDTSDIYEGVVGAGARLAYVLENKYGIRSIHHTTAYDEENGRSARLGSYERMEPDIQKILDENPSIQLVIDIHRDGIEPNPELYTVIDGKRYAKIMFVNGVAAINEGGEVYELDYLKNPYLDTNLALSFNMQMAANTLYPDFTRRIYLKTYRFSTHMRPRSLLVEIGSQYNTKEEAFNAMELLADLIDQVVFN